MLLVAATAAAAAVVAAEAANSGAAILRCSAQNGHLDSRCCRVRLANEFAAAAATAKAAAVTAKAAAKTAAWLAGSQLLDLFSRPGDSLSGGGGSGGVVLELCTSLVFLSSFSLLQSRRKKERTKKTGRRFCASPSFVCAACASVSYIYTHTYIYTYLDVFLSHRNCYG